jgi:transcriptional regulator with XRE-family HTH domain
MAGRRVEMVEPGATLREIRKARKMTLREIGDKIGKSVSYLSEVERGKVGVRIQTLIAWAEVLGYDIEILFKDK